MRRAAEQERGRRGKWWDQNLSDTGTGPPNQNQQRVFTVRRGTWTPTPAVPPAIPATALSEFCRARPGTNSAMEPEPAAPPPAPPAPPASGEGLTAGGRRGAARSLKLPRAPALLQAGTSPPPRPRGGTLRSRFLSQSTQKKVHRRCNSAHI